MTVYSHSRLACFEQCAFKFKLKYLDNIKKEGETSIEAFMGTIVHEILEKLYKDFKFDKLNTLETLIKKYNREWKKRISDKVKVVRKEYDSENYRKLGEKYITNYYNSHQPFNDSKTLGIEQRIVLDLDGTGKYKIQGFIDRLSLKGKDTIEIHDYKTAGSLPTQKYLDDDRQLALYSIAVKEMYPFVKKIKLIWHYLAFDVDMASTRTEKDLEMLKKDIISLMDKIHTNNVFEPKESALCSWCEYPEECPVKKHESIIKKLAPLQLHTDTGVNLVTKYVELKKIADEAEKELSEIRDKLFEYSSKTKMDNLTGKNGVIARLRTYTNLKMPGKNATKEIEEIKTLLEKASILETFMVLDTFNLGRAINSGQIDKELSDKIMRFAEKTYIRKVYLSGLK
ncbi:MAG: PD-(D/E)XK nuclease family protein [Candidatus Aenigmarchaeota archaeon]|nr:PD-(D/E)XK nuclease family protein [Candidatus Aenigmarchaeota archaeon]